MPLDGSFDMTHGPPIISPYRPRDLWGHCPDSELVKGIHKMGPCLFSEMSNGRRGQMVS